MIVGRDRLGRFNLADRGGPYRGRRLGGLASRRGSEALRTRLGEFRPGGVPDGFGAGRHNRLGGRHLRHGPRRHRDRVVDRDGEPRAGTDIGRGAQAVRLQEGRGRHAVALGQQVHRLALAHRHADATAGRPAAEGRAWRRTGRAGVDRSGRFPAHGCIVGRGIGAQRRRAGDRARCGRQRLAHDRRCPPGRDRAADARRRRGGIVGSRRERVGERVRQPGRIGRTAGQQGRHGAGGAELKGKSAMPGRRKLTHLRTHPRPRHLWTH